MTLLLTIAGFLRGPFRAFLASVPPWVWTALLVAVAVGATWLAGDQHGHSAQKLSDAKAYAKVMADLNTSEANADTLKAALAIQNATIEQMAAAGKVAHAGVATAVRKGTQARQATSGVSGRLDAVSRPVAGKTAVVGDLTADEAAAWGAVK